MTISLPVVAGAISTTIFALSALPMLRKAVQTKDLHSYSLSNMLLNNAGNAVHSLYVFSLPPGPIWVLHSFYLASSALMLAWYLRYQWRPERRSERPAKPGEERGIMPAGWTAGRHAEQSLG